MSRTDAVVVDTHALLWWMATSDRLSESARQAITGAADVLISPITFWEVGMLMEKGRVALDRPTIHWTHDLLADPGIELVQLTPAVAVTAAALPGFHGDPADRFIFASALSLGVPLVTKDDRLRTYADADGRVTTIW